MPEGKRPAEDLYSAKTHLHQPVPEVSTVNATALPADAPELLINDNTFHYHKHYIFFHKPCQ